VTGISVGSDALGFGLIGVLVDAGTICSSEEINCPTEDVDAESTANVTPNITSISPAQGMVGTAINVTINGSGFESSATVNAGSNIVVSNVQFVSASQITATFTPTNSASAGGNQSVTVTVEEQQSKSQDFLNQVPTHIGRIGEPGTGSSGMGTIVSGTNITVTDLSGNVLATNVCGGYEWFTYALADQNGNQITTGTATMTESFSNILPNPDPLPDPVAKSSQPNFGAGQILSDILAIYSPAPSCPPANIGDSFNQSWTATVNGTVYPLLTVIHITRSTNSQALPTFTSTITTD
jgi:hypothetical protein